MAIDLRKLLFMQQAQNEQNQNNLLSTNQAQSGLLGGLMSDPTARLLIGANLIGAGVKGSDPFSAITPAVLQTAQIQKALTPKAQRPFEAKDTKTGDNVFITNTQFRNAEPGRFVPKGEDTGKIARDQTETLQKLFTGNSVVKDFNTATSQYEKLLTSSERETAAGDMSMIFTYMKILDPTSVVREGEQATAKEAGAVPDRVLNSYNKAVTGQKLTTKQRADFVQTGTQLYNTNIKQFDAFKNSFMPSLKEYKIEPNKVFLSSDLRPKQIKLKDGQVIDSTQASVIGFDSATKSIVYQLPDGRQFKIKK
jgi:hypothetical protein